MGEWLLSYVASALMGEILGERKEGVFICLVVGWHRRKGKRKKMNEEKLLIHTYV